MMMHEDRQQSTYRFGFDIGGTFTDFVLIDAASGRISTYKTLTTPHNPSQAVMEGWHKLLQEVDAVGSNIDTAIHGTTLITNALISAATSIRPYMELPSLPTP
jgi:5-oxoprolinase (ATP-hydrolysing)/N-methylhydantoinase A